MIKKNAIICVLIICLIIGACVYLFHYEIRSRQVFNFDIGAGDDKMTPGTMISYFEIKDFQDCKLNARVSAAKGYYTLGLYRIPDDHIAVSFYKAQNMDEVNALYARGVTPPTTVEGMTLVKEFIFEGSGDYAIDLRDYDSGVYAFEAVVLDGSEIESEVTIEYKLYNWMLLLKY